jgi:hypothetical protein
MQVVDGQVAFFPRNPLYKHTAVPTFRLLLITPLSLAAPGKYMTEISSSPSNNQTRELHYSWFDPSNVIKETPELEKPLTKRMTQETEGLIRSVVIRNSERVEYIYNYTNAHCKPFLA